MIQFILFCFSVSMVCLTIHTLITRPGMLLNFAEHQLSRDLPEWLKKPLYDCLICMASFWTCLIFIIVTWDDVLNLNLMLFAVLVVAGMNILICAIMDKLTDYGC